MDRLIQFKNVINGLISFSSSFEYLFCESTTLILFHSFDDVINFRDKILKSKVDRHTAHIEILHYSQKAVLNDRS